MPVWLTIRRGVREQERLFFERIKPKLIERHSGKSALIMGQELFGLFDDPRKAFDEGVKLFGRGNFLVGPLR